ncbi:MAG: hypothetical protein J6039_04190, partial [Alphaproteobacteria bacterium]|nr:hypothetical protein [Alphaproteobacteria bacterium]
AVAKREKVMKYHRFMKNKTAVYKTTFFVTGGSVETRSYYVLHSFGHLFSKIATTVVHCCAL